MKLDAITLTGATMTISGHKKMTTYEYLWTDANAVEESGLGIKKIDVTGLLLTAAARDTLEAACEAAGTKKLYFPSEIGESDDRYYIVYTDALTLAPSQGSATVYAYTLHCYAAAPAVYDASTDEVIW